MYTKSTAKSTFSDHPSITQTFQSWATILPSFMQQFWIRNLSARGLHFVKTSSILEVTNCFITALVYSVNREREGSFKRTNKLDNGLEWTVRHRSVSVTEARGRQHSTSPIESPKTCLEYFVLSSPQFLLVSFSLCKWLRLLFLSLRLLFLLIESHRNCSSI